MCVKELNDKLLNKWLTLLQTCIHYEEMKNYLVALRTLSHFRYCQIRRKRNVSTNLNCQATY